jgi:hypothetical protein
MSLVGPFHKDVELSSNVVRHIATKPGIDIKDEK